MQIERMGWKMMGNAQKEEMEQHLLFHKALAEDTESFERIGGYMRILQTAESGEKLNDPVDESIRSVFSLVLENGIDPWEIDLGEFVKMYSGKVKANTFDMIVAGKLLLMAWKILKLQSEATCIRGSAVEQTEDFSDADFAFEDEDVRLTVPEVSFQRPFQRDTVRPVTMYELIDAFEDARQEMEVQQERERVRAELRAKEPKKFDNKAHDEDDEKDVESVWKTIQKLGAGPIPMTDLYTRNLMEDLRTFVSILHLVRDGRLDVWQESLPRGEIFVEIKIPGISDAAGAPEITAVN